MSTTTLSPPLPAPTWRSALIALALLLVALGLLYHETAVAMVGIWARSETFTHAFLVPPISLWLIWRQRQTLAQMAPRPALWVLLPMAVIGLAWLLGDLAAVNAVTQFAFVTLLVLAVPAVLGWRVAQALMFPLGFLFFAVPVGEFLLPIFMLWTADFTVLALRLSGIPVYREGLQFVIPSGNWSVVEACSGVRYLMASLVVGTLFAYLNYRSYKRRLVFIGVALLVPIVANWLRAYMIVMIGHLSSNRLAVGADHLLYGWVFFGVVIGVMFWIGARWRQPEADAPRAFTWAAVGQPAAAASTFWSVAVVAALVAGLPHLGRAAVESAERDRGQPRMAALGVPGWQASDEALAAGWKPSFHGAAAEYSKVMRHASDGVGLYIGYYRQQDYDRKLVTSTNSLVRSDNRTWVQVSQSARDVATSEGSVRVREALLRGSPVLRGSAAPMMRVWQTYWIDGHLTTSDHVAKVLTTLSRLRGRGDDGAVLVFYALESQPGDAEPALQAFVAAGLPVLRAQLQQMSDGSVAALAQRQ
jgi:exosortase A